MKQKAHQSGFCGVNSNWFAAIVELFAMLCCVLALVQEIIGQFFSWKFLLGGISAMGAWFASHFLQNHLEMYLESIPVDL